MGKKTKIGKARKDKFYQLAKETGYRSRAAFKLIQLNRKFEFLQKSRVVVDLCAAPGGWAQVAAENTPVSSLIVAIDLVPIRAIHKVTCLQEDITTEKCRQSLRKELQTWKADCFLNDGAPNVGKNWLHDAFQQATLTLYAMKLATEFLRKGGWFITKVFRSKDYNALLWAFQQLFQHVHATKPQASRNESAEIFVVCQGFLAPDKIDPKFLDPKHVFKDVTPDAKPVALNMIHPEKKRKQSEGYPEGDYTLFHPLSASEFINSDQFTDLLSTASSIILDDDKILHHKLTTPEIKQCCEDVKVLGKKELKSLISWRKKIKAFLDGTDGKPTEEKEEEKVEEEVDEEAEIEKQLKEAKETERKALKRKLKKIRLEKNKLRHKMDMKMVIPGDVHDFTDDIGLFHLDKMKNKKQLDLVEVGEIDLGEEDEGSEGEGQTIKRPLVSFDKENKDYLDSDSEEDKEDIDMEKEESDDESEEETTNPLLVSLEDKEMQSSHEVNSWFGKDVFAGLENEADENVELQKMSLEYKKKGGVVIETKKTTETKEVSKGIPKTTEQDDSDSGNESDPDEESVSDDSDSESDDSDSDSDSDSDIDGRYQQESTPKPVVKKKGKLNNANKDGFEVVASDLTGIDPHLDPTGLAIGAAMATSRKRKRDIIDQAYNRYTFEDPNLPDWFSTDEKKHHRRPLPVTKEEVNAYKLREREINARPIKKVAEAKARKKRKVMKKLEKVRKKSEAICDSMDVSEREKWSQIKHIYKKAGLLKNQKKELTYVVAKKGAGKRVQRPAGVQGHFKVVDPRMKKDLRKQKAMDKQKKGKGKKGKKR